MPDCPTLSHVRLSAQRAVTPPHGLITIGVQDGHSRHHSLSLSVTTSQPSPQPQPQSGHLTAVTTASGWPPLSTSQPSPQPECGHLSPPHSRHHSLNVATSLHLTAVTTDPGWPPLSTSQPSPQPKCGHLSPPHSRHHRPRVATSRPLTRLAHYRRVSARHVALHGFLVCSHVCVA